MKYDFTSIIDRKGKDALAIDALGNGYAPDAPKDGFDADEIMEETIKGIKNKYE